MASALAEHLPARGYWEMVRGDDMSREQKYLFL